MFLQSNARPVIKFILVPSTIIGALFVPLLVHSLLGFSVKRELPQDVTVMAHKVVVVANHKERIEVWGIVKDSSRLYSIPYTEKLEQALQEAAEGRKKGMRSSLKKGQKKDGRQGGGDEDGGPEDNYEVQLVQPDGFTTKDAPDEE